MDFGGRERNFGCDLVWNRSALSVKFMHFNDISHCIFSPWELVHEAEITFSLVVLQGRYKKKCIYMCIPRT